MRKGKRGGFLNLFGNNEPEMTDKYGNKINYVAPTPVGNVSSFSGLNNTTIDTSTMDSTPYYNMSPYKEVLGKIASKDMNQYRSLTCANQRKDVEIFSNQLSRAINKNETALIKGKLYDAKNRRAMCFSNSKRKLMEIKNNMDLNRSITGGRKNKTYKRNKKSRKTRKNKRSSKK